TAKPSRIALSKGGESASAKTSSRRTREILSNNGTGSAGIQSARSFAFAVDRTISSPRSILSILENFSRFRDVKHEIVLVDAQIDGPAIFELDEQGRAALGHMHIAFVERDAELLGFCQDIGSNRICSLSCGRCKFHFLPDEIIELECCEIGWT